MYEARVKGTEETVAIKVIPVGENDDIEEIQKEIDMLKECEHPNVVHYLVRFLHCITCSIDVNSYYSASHQGPSMYACKGPCDHVKWKLRDWNMQRSACRVTLQVTRANLLGTVLDNRQQEHPSVPAGLTGRLPEPCGLR